jgi:hypothetical protein
MSVDAQDEWVDVRPFTPEQVLLLRRRIWMTEMGVGVLTHEEAKRRLAKWLQLPNGNEQP